MPSLSVPQPPPIHNPAEPCIVDLVSTDLVDRKAFGVSKYGNCLKADDGRDTLVDVYQEALDLVIYLRKAIKERDDAAVNTDPTDEQAAQMAEVLAEYLRKSVKPELISPPVITPTLAEHVRNHFEPVKRKAVSKSVVALLPGKNLPKPFTDEPWVEMEDVTACACCGDEQLQGESMRQDKTGPVCFNCVAAARCQERKVKDA